MKEEKLRTTKPISSQITSDPENTRKYSIPEVKNFKTEPGHKNDEKIDLLLKESNIENDRLKIRVKMLESERKKFQ